MPSNDPVQRFQDILDNVARIEDYTRGLNLTEFMRDNRTYDAVERCLQRISEASKKLGNIAETMCPAIPWPSLRSLGNFLRHEYDRIEGERIWYMIGRDLPPLKAAVGVALRKLRNSEESGPEPAL